MTERWEPRPVPEVTVETEPFWAGAAAGEYRLTACGDCESVAPYPLSHCPTCGADSMEWITASGEGTVYSFTVTEHRREWPEEALPLVVARVELAEGPRVVTNIVDCDPESLSIGDPVTVDFVPTEDDDVAVPVFRPVE